MSRINYKTTRNKKSNEFTPGPPLQSHKSSNQITVFKLFPANLITKMTEWEQGFIRSLKDAHYKWSQKQVQTLRKLEKKYRHENNKTKNQDARNTRQRKKL